MFRTALIFSAIFTVSSALAQTSVSTQRADQRRSINIQTELGAVLATPIFTAAASANGVAATVIQGLGLIPQIRLSDRLALVLPAHLNLYSFSTSPFSGMSLTWFQVGAGLDIGLSSEGVMRSGWILSPTAEFAFLSSSVTGFVASGTAGQATVFAPTLLIGYKWQFESGLNLGLRAGANTYIPMTASTLESNRQGPDVPSSKIMVLPALSLTLGYAF